MEEIPPIEDIVRNPEKYFEIPKKENAPTPKKRNLDQYDPSRFFSANEVLEEGTRLSNLGEFYKDELSNERLAAALYLIASIFDFKDFIDVHKNFEEEAETSIYDSTFLKEVELTYWVLDNTIRCAFPNKQIFFEKSKDYDKRSEIFKAESEVYQIYTQLIEKFGKIKPPC